MSIKTTLFSVVKTALAGTIAVFLASGAVNADEQVLKAQRLLNALGFDPGPIDGSWGLKTESAMKKFLSDQNLVWDGSFDLEEFNFLEGKSKNYSAEKLITEAITLHDVGGWHMPIWNDGLYKTTIDRVARVVNANTVTVVDTHFIIGSSVNGYQIAYSPDTRDWTPTDEQWKLIGSYATKNNLNLQMLVMLHNEIGINKYEVEEHADKIGDVKFWDTYFAEYSRLVSKRAIVAELAGVDSIILGYNGAIDLGQNPKYWIKLIDDIKMSGFTGEIGLFTGLSVGNNWSGISDAVYRSSQKNVNKIISQFDFIVFQTQDIEKAGLSRVIRAHKKYKKPIQIMVITPSVVTGISRPEYIEPIMGQNNATNSLAPYRDLSVEIQSAAYQAVIDIINDPNFNYVTGVNSWGYAFRDDLFYGITRGDSDYQKSANIRGKPAEELVAHWYKLWQASSEIVDAVDQPQAAKEEALSNEDLCNKAIRLVYSSTGKAWKWSEEPETVGWVGEAKQRGLDCGVMDAPLNEGAVVVDKAADAINDLVLSDSDLCKNSIELVIDQGVNSWQWTEDIASREWVEQAKERGLSCGVSRQQISTEVVDVEIQSASDASVCSAAKRLFFTSNGTKWRWSEEPEAATWVAEAMKRQLDCDILP